MGSGRIWRWAAVRLALGLLATWAVGLSSAASAFAGEEYYMGTQGLSHGNAYASVSAHSGYLLTEGAADHTHCPAVAQGYSGYTSQPFSGGRTTYYNPYGCGPGQVYFGLFNTNGSYFHGAEYNPNGSTYDNFWYSKYYWW